MFVEGCGDLNTMLEIRGSEESGIMIDVHFVSKTFLGIAWCYWHCFGNHSFVGRVGHI